MVSKPIVGILSTGSELVADELQNSSSNGGKIRDCNRPMLIAAAAEEQVVVKDLGTTTSGREKSCNITIFRGVSRFRVRTGERNSRISSTC